MQCLDFIYWRLCLAAVVACADTTDARRRREHALVAAIERERCLDEPALEPPDAELLELPHAHEGNWPELVGVDGDRPRPLGIRACRLHDPRSRRRTLHLVDDARTLCRSFEDLGGGVEIDLRRVGVADPQLEGTGGRCREHPADARPQCPNTQIPLAQISALAAFVSPQRAAQLVA